MVSSAIWKKHARVSFSKTIKIARLRRTNAIWGLWKTHEFYYLLIIYMTNYLLIIYMTMLCRVQSYACVTCKLIDSLLIVNIFRTKNICQKTEIKQCVLIINNVAMFFHFWLSANENCEIFSGIILINIKEFLRK